MPSRKWLDDTPYERLDRNLKRLGLTMLIGAVYDTLLGLSGLLFPSLFVQWMGFSGTNTEFVFWPLVHLMLPCVCVLAWMDTKRNVAIVAGAIMARVVYALVTFLAVAFLGARPVWAILGGISVVLAVLHYVLLRLSDFGFWEVVVRAGNPPGLQRQ